MTMCLRRTIRRFEVLAIRTPKPCHSRPETPAGPGRSGLPFPTRLGVVVVAEGCAARSRGGIFFTPQFQPLQHLAQARPAEAHLRALLEPLAQSPQRQIRLPPQLPPQLFYFWRPPASNI